MTNRLTKIVLCVLALPALAIPLLCLAYLLARGLPGFDSNLFGFNFDASLGESSLNSKHGILPQTIGSFFGLPISVTFSLRLVTV